MATCLASMVFSSCRKDHTTKYRIVTTIFYYFFSVSLGEATRSLPRRPGSSLLGSGEAAVPGRQTPPAPAQDLLDAPPAPAEADLPKPQGRGPAWTRPARMQDCQPGWPHACPLQRLPEHQPEREGSPPARPGCQVQRSGGKGHAPPCTRPRPSAQRSTARPGQSWHGCQLKLWQAGQRQGGSETSPGSRPGLRHATASQFAGRRKVRRAHRSRRACMRPQGKTGAGHGENSSGRLRGQDHDCFVRLPPPP